MAHQKLILVGQAPSRSGDRTKVLEGAPMISKLAVPCGLTKQEYLAASERHNLLRRWPGKSGKGDRFPFPAAKRNAADLAARLVGRRVILLGRNVAHAFGVDLPYLTWSRLHQPFAVAVFPHPSGINRWWNNALNRKAAARFMTGAWNGDPNER